MRRSPRPDFVVVRDDLTPLPRRQPRRRRFPRIPIVPPLVILCVAAAAWAAFARWGEVALWVLLGWVSLSLVAVGGYALVRAWLADRRHW